MTPEAEAELQYTIGRTLRGLTLRVHTGSDAFTRTLYRVIDERGTTPIALTPPCSLELASKDQARLQTDAVLQLIKEIVPDARDEGLKARGAA